MFFSLGHMGVVVGLCWRLWLCGWGGGGWCVGVWGGLGVWVFVGVGGFVCVVLCVCVCVCVCACVCFFVVKELH